MSEMNYNEIISNPGFVPMKKKSISQKVKKQLCKKSQRKRYFSNLILVVLDTIKIITNENV